MNINRTKHFLALYVSIIEFHSFLTMNLKFLQIGFYVGSILQGFLFLLSIGKYSSDFV